MKNNSYNYTFNMKFCVQTNISIMFVSFIKKLLKPVRDISVTEIISG